MNSSRKFPRVKMTMSQTVIDRWTEGKRDRRVRELQAQIDALTAEVKRLREQRQGAAR